MRSETAFRVHALYPGGLIRLVTQGTAMTEWAVLDRSLERQTNFQSSKFCVIILTCNCKYGLKIELAYEVGLFACSRFNLKF